MDMEAVEQGGYYIRMVQHGLHSPFLPSVAEAKDEVNMLPRQIDEVRQPG